MMTKRQRFHMMAELWPAACAVQGWNKNDHAKRYEIFARVLTAPGHRNREKHLRTLQHGDHISFNDFDNADFDAVKKELRHLADSISIRNGDQARLLWVIRNVQLRQIAVYRPNVEAYVGKILRERFKRFPGINTIEDLSTIRTGEKESPLEQLRITLAARINYLRKQAGDTIHFMNFKARTKCNCAACHGQIPPMPGWYEESETNVPSENEPF